MWCPKRRLGKWGSLSCRRVVYIGLVEKQSILSPSTMSHVLPRHYLHADAPVCLHGYVRVWGVMFVFECDSVYFVRLRTLRLRERVLFPLVRERTYVFAWRPGGCVFDKLWEHVGDCLSIPLGESGRKRVGRGGGGVLFSSLYLQVNQCSNTKLFILPFSRMMWDRQRDGQKDRLKINMFQRGKQKAKRKRQRFNQTAVKEKQSGLLFRRIKVLFLTSAIKDIYPILIS